VISAGLDHDTVWARLSPERTRRAFALLILSTLYFGYVFRVPTGEWRRTGLGDWIDPYFINSLLEAWRFSLTHLRSPISPPVFFPVPGTLGYSHSLVLYAPFYIVARLWLPPFTAYTITLFAIIEIGTLSLYVVFRKFAKLTFVESLIFVAAFATSANVISGSTGVWSQRASVFLVPPILLLGLWSACCWRGRQRWIGLACTGALAVSLLTHDIYTGLLTALIASLLLAGARVILRWPRLGIRVTLWRRRPGPVSTARRRAIWAGVAVIGTALVWAWTHEYNSLLGIRFDIHHRHPGRALAIAVIAAVAVELLRGGARDRVAVVDSKAASDAAAAAAGALAGLVVFVSMYAGAYAEHHRFPAAELLDHLTPVTLVPFDAGRSLVMVFVLGAAAWLPWFHVPGRIRLFSLWFLLVTIIALAIPVRIGDFAVWRFLSDAPGFSAIRDPRRIQYPFELAAALGMGLLVAELPRSSAIRWSVALFVLIVVAAKWNRERFDYERPFDVFQRFVEAPIAIDPSCRSFFIRRAESVSYESRSPNLWALYANDAAFIAMKYAIPTLNGYSAWTPPDWHLFNPSDADYDPGVAQWIALNRLDHVCALDIDRRIMTPYSAAASPGLPR